MTAVVVTVLAWAGLVALWLALLIRVVSLVVPGATLRRRLPLVSRWARRLPSWRLFGQSVGVFDVRLAVEWGPAGEPLAQTFIEPRRTRRLRDAVVNPLAHPRALRRRAAYAVVESVERGDDPRRERGAFVEQLRREGERLVVAQAGAGAWEYAVYVVMDRGWFSAEPPQARARLGPFRTDGDAS